MIKEIAFVSYPVADLARAVAFYRDTIGLSVAESFGDEVVEFDIGSGTFSVDANAIGEPGTQTSAAFEVDDLASMQAELAEKGVAVSHVFEHAVRFVALVTDPDGNRFMLHERKANV